MDTVIVSDPAVVADAEALDLEALFDEVSAQRERSLAAPVAAGEPAPGTEAYDVFQRVGHLTRKLHDALHELGYDKAVEEAVGALPDARTRLDYIARLTGQAADRVLGATEKGQELDNALEGEARALSTRWQRLFAGELSVDEFRSLALDSRAFIDGIPARAATSRGLYTDIMVAQDFHDLTGQVIQRIVAVAQNLEGQLVKLLLETTPPDRRNVAEGFLTGPAVVTQGRDEVVSSQKQVDDLLESLGF